MLMNVTPLSGIYSVICFNFVWTWKWKKEKNSEINCIISFKFYTAFTINMDTNIYLTNI